MLGTCWVTFTLTRAQRETRKNCPYPRRIPTDCSVSQAATVRDLRRHRCMKRILKDLLGNGRGLPELLNFAVSVHAADPRAESSVEKQS